MKSLDLDIYDIQYEICNGCKYTANSWEEEPCTSCIIVPSNYEEENEMTEADKQSLRESLEEAKTKPATKFEE